MPWQGPSRSVPPGRAFTADTTQIGTDQKTLPLINMRRRAAAAASIAAAVLLLAAVPSATAGITSGRPDDAPQQAPSKPPPQPQLWIVTLADDPAVVADYKAAASISSTGSSSQAPRFSAAAESVVQHAAYIRQQADATARRALGAAGAGKVRHYYTHTLAGFSAGPLTSQQVAALRQQPNVKSVVSDVLGHSKTISTPNFLGLDSPGGAWSQLGGAEHAGEDIIIGVFDTGELLVLGSLAVMAAC